MLRTTVTFDDRTEEIVNKLRLMGLNTSDVVNIAICSTFSGLVMTLNDAAIENISCLISKLLSPEMIDVISSVSAELGKQST